MNSTTHADLTDGSDLDFAYDAAGRRLAKIYTEVINNVTYETKYTYHYIGSQITTIDISGKEDETITKNDQMRIHLGANSRPISFEYYTDIGTEQQASETYYYHYDLHGNVIRVTDDTGTTQITYTYDSLGTILTESNTNSIYNPFTWSGEAQVINDPEFDTSAASPKTGLYNSGSGYYNPETGTFLSGTGTPADVNPTSTRHEDVSAMLTRPMEQQLGDTLSSTQGGLTVGAEYAPATTTAPEDPYEGMDKAGMIRIESGDLNLRPADPESVLIRKFRGDFRERPDDGTVIIPYKDDELDPLGPFANVSPEGGNGSFLDNPYACLTDQISANYDCVPVDDIPPMTLVKPQVVQDQGNYRPNMPEEEESGLAFVGGGSGEQLCDPVSPWIPRPENPIGGGAGGGSGWPSGRIDDIIASIDYEWGFTDGIIKMMKESNTCRQLIENANIELLKRYKHSISREGYKRYSEYISNLSDRLAFWILKIFDIADYYGNDRAAIVGAIYSAIVEYELQYGMKAANNNIESFKKWLVARLLKKGFIKHRQGNAN